MSDKILVTGATAPLGRELVRLLASAGIEVKAGTRHPERAGRLFAPTVEVVELDFERPATFDAAVEWADRLLLQPPAFDPDAHQTLAPLLDWAVQAGVGQVVTVSAMGMDVREDLPLRRLEHHIESLGIDYTFLRPNFYMQSFGEGLLGDRIRRTSVFRMPVDDAEVSIVDARDVADVAARALTQPNFSGRSFTLTGPQSLTHGQVAGVLTRVLGRDIAFSTCTDQEMLDWLLSARWRPDVAGMAIALYQSVRGGVRAPVTGDVEEVLGRPARTLEAFALEHRELWG